MIFKISSFILDNKKKQSFMGILDFGLKKTRSNYKGCSKSGQNLKLSDCLSHFVFEKSTF